MKWLEKHKETIAQFRDNKKALFDAKNIYNGLCPKCKRITIVKIKHGKTAKMKDYCDSCQKEIISKYGDKYN